MLMDSTTEIIAHFIGFFDQTVEENRARLEYLKFKALKQADNEFKDLLNLTYSVKAPLALEDYTPGVRYVPEWLPLDYVRIPVNFPLEMGHDAPDFFGVFDDLQLPPFYAILYGQAQPHFLLEPAGSVVTFTFQSNFLLDDDYLHFNLGTEFILPAYFHNVLADLVTIASALEGFDPGEMPALGESAISYAIANYDQIADIADHGLTGSNVTILTGSEAQGMFQNGQAVSELPALKDILPTYLRPEDDDGTSDLPPDALADAGLNGHDPMAALFALNPGHEVLTGGNFLINETNIASGWLDAPVISVVGDVVNLKVISQTNVLLDYDGGRIHVTGSGPSAAYNLASITLSSSQPDPSVNGETGSAPDSLGLPLAWAVTRIDGDVLAVNWVQQYTFAYDNDRAEILFTGSQTYIATGENSLFNVASLLEIGYGYDLIIIGGHMISMSMLIQTNVLLDSDNASYGGTAPGSVSMDDNLLLNWATINSIGIDTYLTAPSPFSGAAGDLAAGAQTISGDVAQLGVFEGIEMLRVLYISGDVTVINLVEQTNILGDADQVYLALENLSAEEGASVSVTTGSNALINIASVSEYGVDSTVYVGGEVYSDALIYQADFIDTDAAPTGVSLQALANEAVAFLADDDANGGNDSDGLSDPTLIGDGSHSPDVMQTMLA